MDEFKPFYCKGFPDDDEPWDDFDYYCYKQCDRCCNIIIEYHRNKRKEDG